MLELIFQGFIEWTYGLILECWEYFSTMLLNIMSMDFAYLKERMPVIEPIMQSMLAIGWALLIGNLVFQAVRGMTSGLGFEAEDPKLLFTRTFVFSFLLLASPQICELCLNMTSRVIEIMEMPDAVDVQFADEASFGGMAVSWLLVIVFGVIVMFQSLKLILEAAERYFILAVLTITAPLAFGVGGSRSTSDIFSGWCRMYGSMCLLTILNVVFVKMLLSVLSFYPSGLDVLPWMVLVVTVVKVARKADTILARIGLNPAPTGDRMGRFPGFMAYTVARTVANNVLHNHGNGSAYASAPRNPVTPPPGSPVYGSAGPTISQMGAGPSSTQTNSVHQASTAQAGGPRSSVSESFSAASVSNTRVNTSTAPAGTASTGSAPPTSVPPGARHTPSHVRPPAVMPAAGTRGTRGYQATAGAGQAVSGAAGTASHGPAGTGGGSPGTAGTGSRFSYSSVNSPQANTSAQFSEQNSTAAVQGRADGRGGMSGSGSAQAQSPGSARSTHRSGQGPVQSYDPGHGPAGTWSAMSAGASVSEPRPGRNTGAAAPVSPTPQVSTYSSTRPPAASVVAHARAQPTPAANPSAAEKRTAPAAPKAAAVSGVEGAAIATAKEAAPFLTKLAIGLLIAAVAVPLFVFVAMPNMFFGFSTSETNTVMDMTEKAMTLGSVYISLKDFENTQVDSVVTGIVSQYENQGVQIDSVEVDSSFDEDDILWMIAINSVAYQQDLNAVTAEDIWDLSFTQLRSRPSVSSLLSDGDGLTTTLKIGFEKLDPEELMESLEFDEEAQTWAGALYELLRDSDALEKYAEYYEPYQTDYSGDSSYDGGYERGEGFNNDIDTSHFIDPYTKNNHDLAAYAVQAWENNWGYVWGTFGNVLTSSVFQYKLEQYPEGVGNYADFIRENWLGHRTADCVGLIKSYGWYNPDTGNIDYGSHGMPDLGADQMYNSAANNGTDYGPMETMPEIEGLALWKSGHIGVYIGGGYAIEAMGTKYGVVRTEVAGRGWQGWCKLPYIEYLEDTP